jgi:hypothetical protein
LVEIDEPELPPEELLDDPHPAAASATTANEAITPNRARVANEPTFPPFVRVRARLTGVGLLPYPTI